MDSLPVDKEGGWGCLVPYFQVQLMLTGRYRETETGRCGGVSIRRNGNDALQLAVEREVELSLTGDVDCLFLCEHDLLGELHRRPV